MSGLIEGDRERWFSRRSFRRRRRRRVANFAPQRTAIFRSFALLAFEPNFRRLLVPLAVGTARRRRSPSRIEGRVRIRLPAVDDVFVGVATVGMTVVIRRGDRVRGCSVR